MEVPEVNPQVTLVTVQSRNGRSKEKRIYLLGHCAFCLKKPDKCPAGDEVGTGRKRPRKQNLKAISMVEQVDLLAMNWTWAALQKRRNEEEDDEKLFDVTGGYLDNDKKVSQFEGAPQICRECLDKVQGIDKLLKELGREIGVLRSFLRQRAGEEDANENGWTNFQESLYNSELPKDGVGDTVQFLEEFRRKIGIQTYDEEADLKMESPKDPLASSDREDDGASSDANDEGEDYIPSKKSKFAPSDSEDEVKEEEASDSVKSESDWSRDDDSTMESDPLTSPSPCPSPSNSDTCSISGSGSFTIKDSLTNKPLFSKVIPMDKNKPNHAVCQVDNCFHKFEGPKWYRTIKLHLQRHHNLKTVEYSCNLGECDECGDKMNLHCMKFVRNHLEGHLKKQKNEDKARVTCDQCGVKLAPEYLPIHKKHSCKISKIEEECALCTKRFNFYLMRVHLKTKHKVNPDDYAPIPNRSADYPQLCDFCKVRLPRKELLDHLEEHVGEEYVIRCPNPDCWFVCVTQKTLVIHIKGHVKSSCLQKAGMTKEKFLKGLNTCSHPSCSFIADHLSHLRIHLLKQHETPEKNFPCPVSGCGMKFTLRQSVVLHLGQHDVQRQVDTQSCLECEDKKKLKLEGMEDHLKEVHGVNQVVKCRKCPFLFASWERLVNHMVQHKHGGLSCDICKEAGGGFSRHTDLAHHYFNQHQIGKMVQCERCPRSFLNLRRLKYHLKYEHEKKDHNVVIKPSFKCKECDMQFRFEDSLRSHQIKFHGGEFYGCNVCSETFIHRQQLIDHENKTHKGVVKPEKLFPCEEPNCGKVFKTKKQLKHHHRVYHLGEKDHVCDLCGKGFTKYSHLKTHLNAVHLGLRKYLCSTCGEAFTTDTVLRRHKLIHTGERPYSCGVCDQRFRHKEVLQRHLISHQEKGADFKPNGPMKKLRARAQLKRKEESQ